jgi:hypothetical protein
VIVQPTFFVPPAIAAGLLTGDLTRWGGVVRDTAGHIVAHLDEIPAPKPNDAVGAAAAWVPTRPVVVAGLATVVVVGSVSAAVAIVCRRRRRRGLPDCVKNYNASLLAYLEAVSHQSLKAEIIDRLIADLDGLKAYSKNSNMTLGFSVEQSEALVQVVIDYTRQLAQANSIDLGELPESTPTSTNASVIDLRRYLESQRRIFTCAA